jgi:heme-degrading monooxygenase HmoA
MPKIKENQLFTVMPEFEVAPQQQQALIDALADQVEQSIKSFPGFVSASFHASSDGERVINYAQWLSKESWEAFMSDESNQAIFKTILSSYGIKTLKVDSFRVTRVIENT